MGTLIPGTDRELRTAKTRAGKVVHEFDPITLVTEPWDLDPTKTFTRVTSLCGRRFTTWDLDASGTICHQCLMRSWGWDQPLRPGEAPAEVLDGPNPWT